MTKRCWCWGSRRVWDQQEDNRDERLRPTMGDRRRHRRRSPIHVTTLCVIDDNMDHPHGKEEGEHLDLKNDRKIVIPRKSSSMGRIYL
jgi:hypothetical protein